jgi:hypothetical protein
VAMRFFAAAVVNVGVYGSTGVNDVVGTEAAAEDGPACGYFSLKSIVGMDGGKTEGGR